MSGVDRLRSVVDRIRDPNPFSHPDERRKWAAAGEVSNGPASRVHVMVHLDGPRRSHALHEGYCRETVTKEGEKA